MVHRIVKFGAYLLFLVSEFIMTIKKKKEVDICMDNQYLEVSFSNC